MNRSGTIRALIIWILITPPVLQAQEVGLTASIGMASVRMDDMKYLLESIMGTYPVEAKVTSSFPPHTSFTLGAQKRLYPQVRIGTGYGFTTSGTKADYSDYSGNLSTQIVAVSHRMGVFAHYAPFAGEHLELSIYGRVDLNLTRMEVSSSISAAGYYNGLSNKYHSVTPQASAGAELLYNFGKYSLGIEGGYLVDKPGKLKGKDGGQELKDPEDSRRVLTSDWTGWRAGIKAILWLDFSKP
jgi:hypothetical protein